jgi:DNA-binding transcriptional LysR family regulator
MNLRHLSIFICVCDQGSMTAAAEKLYMTQPSVSQAIAELERHYKVPLFERFGKKLYLTEAGKKLQAYARHILHLCEEAEKTMQNLSDFGTLRVGASITVGITVLNKRIQELLELNPNLKIIPRVDNSSVVEAMLLAAEADLGLIEGDIHSPDLIAKPFMEDELILICAPTHPWAAKGTIQPEELKNQGFIVREEGSGTRELFASVMLSHKIPWKIAGIHNNPESTKNAVAAGLGIAVISKLLVQKEIERGELVPVKIHGISFKRHFHLVYHKNKYFSTGMKQFADLCCLNLY